VSSPAPVAGGAGGAILTGDWSRATGPAGDHRVMSFKVADQWINKYVI